MSTIQSSSVALGCRSAVSAGIASVNTVRPIHSRRVAFGGTASIIGMGSPIQRERRALRILAQATERAGDHLHLLEVLGAAGTGLEMGLEPPALGVGQRALDVVGDELDRFDAIQVESPSAVTAS